ncbi:hypothetical protein [Candidatus Tisiphia endosymbiont of Ptychoptera albimana]|uniref:outer membrane protein n=1 Tax=Candidatus Tisiphia endosymbiont of Ptychoptera albimana TaxID=3066260 RepID=UPI00312CC1C3
MRKLLLLIAVATSVILTSTISIADENQFYVKAEVGATILSEGSEANSNIRKKHYPIKAISGFGVGYYVMNNVRVDLTLDFVPKLESSKIDKNILNIVRNDNKTLPKISQTRAEVAHKAKVESLLLNSYIDLYGAGIAKFFIGAGVGMAQIKETITATVKHSDTVTNPMVAVSASSKKANNFAYQLTIGTSINVLDHVNFDVVYSWRDYGKVSSKQYKYNDTEKKYSTAEMTKNSYRTHNVIAGIRFDI